MTPNSSSSCGDDSSSAGSGGSGAAALKKGPWTAAEDAILMDYVKKNGEGNWNSVQKNSGLSRCGKSCRLRWANHLRPNLKKGSFTPEEERLILELHSKLGNKWARMASQLPGRTDNEIKNYWNTRIKRRQRAGLPLYPSNIQRQSTPHHHHHHHHHRPSHSPFPSPSSTIPSLQQKIHFPSPLPLSNPMNFNTPNHHNTFPPPPIHQFKPFQNHSSIGPSGFSLSFPSSPLPFFNQTIHNQPQLQHQKQNQQTHEFNQGNFDLDPMIFQPNFEPNGLSMSMKLELPSNQMSRTNSELLELDALLQEGSSDIGREGLLAKAVDGKCSLEGWDDVSLPDGSLFCESATPLLGEWDGSTTTHSSIEINAKKESTEENNSVDEDISTLLDFIPTSMQTVPEWYNESGEMLNRQSSVTDDNMQLEMQQLASSLTVATDQEWSLGSCTWNNMPGIR